METFPIFHVDTFTETPFCGNPAVVCILSKWLPDSILHAIAKENHLSVTAFLMKEKEQYQIRWITPEYELDICGHGTLAAAFVVFHFLELTWKQVELKPQRESLTIFRNKNLITLDFPAGDMDSIDLPVLQRGLGMAPKEVYQGGDRYIAVYRTEEEVLQLKPDREILMQLEHRGIVVTAPGNSVDFVSRTFYPKKAILEDAVTGISHALLAPYWAKRLNKQELHAKQLSKRGGELFCQCRDNHRVLIGGKAVLYMQGTIMI